MPVVWRLFFIGAEGDYELFFLRREGRDLHELRVVLRIAFERHVEGFCILARKGNQP
jgi:hypothetical protein